MSWIDIVIAAIFLIATLKGFKRGFIMELAGGFALLCALATPWLYNGAFDGALSSAAHMNAGSAHILAMVLVGIATYVAVMILARILSAIAKMPIIGLGNALGGAAVAIVKAAVVLWLILYVALLFPLPDNARRDLHRSVLVGVLTIPDAYVDNALSGTLPSFARPLLDPLLGRHRV